MEPLREEPEDEISGRCFLRRLFRDGSGLSSWSADNFWTLWPPREAAFAASTVVLAVNVVFPLGQTLRRDSFCLHQVALCSVSCTLSKVCTLTRALSTITDVLVSFSSAALVPSFRR